MTDKKHSYDFKKESLKIAADSSAFCCLETWCQRNALQHKGCFSNHKEFLNDQCSHGLFTLMNIPF